MDSVKTQAITLIEALPDQCSLEDIHYHLYVYEKIQRGLKAIDEGCVFSQQEAEEKVQECFQSFGQNPH